MPRIRDISFKHVECDQHSDIECHIAAWIWRIVPFSLIIIGTVGNILCLLVLSRKRLRKHSTTVYLLAMAASDLGVLYMFVLDETIYAVSGIEYWSQTAVACKMKTWLSYVAGMTSITLLMTITIERVLMIKSPWFSRKTLTRRKATQLVFSTIVIVSILSVHCLFGFDIQTIGKFTTLKTYNNTIQNITACIYASESYRQFFTKTWTVVIAVIFVVIPTLIILTGNVILAKEILHRRRSVGACHELLTCRKNKGITPSESKILVRRNTHNPAFGKARRFTASCYHNDNLFQVEGTSAMWSRTEALDKAKKRFLENKVSTENAKVAKNHRRVPLQRLTVANLYDIKHPKRTIHLNISNERKSRPKLSDSERRVIFHPTGFTVCLFVVSTFFIITMLPYAVYNVAKNRVEVVSTRTVPKLQLVHTFVYCLLYSNFALNFLFYFIKGAAFRKETKLMFLDVKKFLLRFNCFKSFLTIES